MENRPARPYYAFFMNGAAIKCHNTFEAALAQARQWKATDFARRVEVVTLDRDLDCYQSGAERVEVAVPMLVPELTKKHDFDWLPALDALGVHQW